jgi:hypothetical protein
MEKPGILLICITILIIVVCSSGCTTSTPAATITQPATVPLQGTPTISSSELTPGSDLHPETPVSITINSARKLARANQDELHTRDETIYVVLNITVKNNDVQEGFDLANTSFILVNLETGKRANRSSNFIVKMDRPLENPLVLPVRIAQNESVTGEVIFRIYDSAQYGLTLVDSNKQVLARQHVSFDSLMTTDNPLSLTINSVEKKYSLVTSHAAPGEIIVILNVTVKNNDLPKGFYFYEGSTTLRDLESGRNLGFSFNEKASTQSQVEDAIILPRTIKQNESLSGKLVFALNNSDTYLLNVVDYDNTILLSRTINITERNA